MIDISFRFQSDHSDESGSESEFEADPEELAASASSDDESDYDDSDAGGSDESGSDFGGGDDDSDEGWLTFNSFDIHCSSFHR
jgi:hypothetical protein